MPKRFFFLFLIFLFCHSADSAENLALRKSYTFSPEPGYPLCTDDLDTIQLTDGKKYGSRWTEKSTVGWRRAEPAVEIIIDLENKYAIDEVRIYTIGGGAATVEFPEYVAVLLSDNNSEYKFAGMISSKELANVRGSGNRGISRTLSIDDINAAGRYVKLVMRPKGLTLFADEVEILARKLTDENNFRLRKTLEVIDSNEKLLGKIDKHLQIKDEIKTTIESEIFLKAGLSKDVRKKVESNLDIPNKIINLPIRNLLTNNEIKVLKNNVGKSRAEIYRAYYEKPFICLPVNPMEIIYEKEMYFQESEKEINVKIWQKEYESAAFNIINCSEEELKISISISPLTGANNKIIDSDKIFTVRRAVYVKGSEIGSIADALVLQQEHHFTVNPGQLSQIWLTIFNPTLTAGSYEGKIAVTATKNNGKKLQAEIIPITIEVQQFKLPDSLALKTCNWSYYEIAPATEMAEDLKSHHTNVYIVPAQDLPFPRFASDPAGVTRNPDYSRLDKVLNQHKYANTFLLGLNFSVARKDFGRFGDVQWMTPEWKEVFSVWLKNLIKHLKERDIGYDRFILYPFDESIDDEYYNLARLIKSIDPEIRLYANSFGKGPEEFIRFKELIDVWCHQDSHCVRYPKWFKTIKNFGKEMWTYECLEPMKAKEPYSYYRLLPWRAFQRGQTGAGFWIYYYGLNFAPGAVPWDDTLKSLGHSGVVYGAKASPVDSRGENIIPSRRWEAWRDGVEDYQYLYELQQAINKIKTKNPQAAKNAQQILDKQVNRVLNNQDDSTNVYKAREILTDTLQKLTIQIN